MPASSPNLSVSNPSLSPVCSSEEGRAVSPLPARLPISALADHTRLPDARVPQSHLDPGQFLPDGNLGLAAYPRLGSSMNMMALGAMPGLPYGASEQNPYSSLSMENFYNPLVSRISRVEFMASSFCMPPALHYNNGNRKNLKKTKTVQYLQAVKKKRSFYFITVKYYF